MKAEGLAEIRARVRKNKAMVYPFASRSARWQDIQHLLEHIDELERLVPEARVALKAIVKQLEMCNFECEAGPLRLNTAFISLQEMAK